MLCHPRGGPGRCVRVRLVDTAPRLAGILSAMRRTIRAILAGVAVSLARGVRAMQVFFSDQNRNEYLNLLAEHGRVHGVEHLGYCPMTNHVHLVAVPAAQGSVARGIGEAHRRYTRMVNFRQRVRGYLFQGRFFSCPLDEAHCLTAVRYVERNPVRAGTVTRPWDYRWSSARFHVGLRKSDALVQDRTLWGLVSNWRAYPRTEEEHDELQFLRTKTHTGRPCGDRAFIRRAQRLTGRKLLPKAPGRPRQMPFDAVRRPWPPIVA